MFVYCVLDNEISASEARKITENYMWDFMFATRFHVGFFLGLFFDPEDGGDIFLRNIG
jgi:hypothetical protein